MPTDSQKEALKVRYEDLTPELQKLLNSFVEKERLNTIKNQVNDLNELVSTVRVSIGFTSPTSPVAGNEIFVDQNGNVPKAFDSHEKWRAIHMVPIEK